MKFFFACLTHETNNHSSLPTTLKNFEEIYLYRPSTGENAGHRDAFYRMLDIPRMARERGFEMADSIIAFAMPSLPLIRPDYEALRAELLADLKRALPVDFVFLFMHGAQMAEGADDVEGDILEAVRAIVGPDVPIGLELDLHANVTPRMAATADIMLACKEYPHTDWAPEAERLLDLLAQTARGEIAPRMAVSYAPMLDLFPTTEEPMRSLVAAIRERERESGVLSVSLTHGFPIADFEHTGAAAVVVTDDDARRAQRMSDVLAREFFALRGKQQQTGLSIDEAIDRVLAAPKHPVVVADMSDSDGGAAPGDSTFFLRRLIERRVEGAALAMIWDPQAVQFASQVGVGSSLPLRIGGKVAPSSGMPLDVKAEVLAIKSDAHQSGLGARLSFGPAVAIRIDGIIDVVLSSVRQQTFSPDCFTELGIDPARKTMLVVKSRQHFHEQFKPIAAEILYAGRFRNLKERLLETPFKRLRRPIWPLDETPFMAHGRQWT